MAVRKIKNSWWVDFRHDHVRHRKKSPDNSKSSAQAYEAVLRQKLARGETLALGEPDKKQKEREQKFREFAGAWLDTYVRSNNKHSEIRNKECTLRRHLVPFFGETPIDKITAQEVEQYKSTKIGEGFANGSINYHLAVLSSCLHTAQAWYGLKTVPKIKKLKASPSKTFFLSREECDMLLANSSGVWHEIIFTALKTGLRRGELIALNWEDINWNNKTLTVWHSWCDCKKELITPKSNRERDIRLIDELYGMLLKRRQTTGFVFVDEKNQRISAGRLHREISKACKRAGIKEITCHTLRHTFASHLAMTGASLIAIQVLLGHSNIQMTMRYAHVSPSTLRETVGLLESTRVGREDSGQYMVNSGQQPIVMPSNHKTVHH